MGIYLFLAFLLAADASKIASLKQQVAGQSKLMSELGVLGPFKLHQNELVAKVSKTSTPVLLDKKHQVGAWNAVQGSSMVEAWAISGSGIHVRNRDKEFPCKSVKGMDAKSSVTLLFSCDPAMSTAMIEKSSQDAKKADAWPVKTGYDGAQPSGDEFEPRVRFWHRCAKDVTDNLSMCSNSKYNYIGANQMGYYGCQYLTVDGYCVKSYRHEWVEFNPNDLPFVFNPPSPCEGDNSDCGPPAGRYASAV